MKEALRRAAVILVGLVVVLCVTFALAGLPFEKSFRLLVEGSVGSSFAWGTSLVRFAPLCLTTLGIVVAWRAGMYNIGGEGQYLMGGAAGALGYLCVRAWPEPLATPVLLVFASLGGAAWAYLAGWLYAKRGVQVVISTILLNFVAVELLSFLVRGPLQQDKHQLPLTQSLPNQVMLMRPVAQSPLHSGVVLAVVVPAAVWWFLFRTRPGLNLRFVGANPQAAHVQKIDVTRTQVLSMALSGALCGLAAGLTYAGVTGQVGDGFGQGWGFLAIPVALLGGLEPIGASVAALFFGALFAGCENLERYTPVGSTIVYVVQAASVLGFVGIERWLAKRGARAG